MSFTPLNVPEDLWETVPDISRGGQREPDLRDRHNPQRRHRVELNVTTSHHRIV